MTPHHIPSLGPLKVQILSKTPNFTTRPDPPLGWLLLWLCGAACVQPGRAPRPPRPGGRAAPVAVAAQSWPGGRPVPGAGRGPPRELPGQATCSTGVPSLVAYKQNHQVPRHQKGPRRREGCGAGRGPGGRGGARGEPRGEAARSHRRPPLPGLLTPGRRLSAGRRVPFSSRHHRARRCRSRFARGQRTRRAACAQGRPGSDPRPTGPPERVTRKRLWRPRSCRGRALPGPRPSCSGPRAALPLVTTRPPRRRPRACPRRREVPRGPAPSPPSCAPSVPRGLRSHVPRRPAPQGPTGGWARATRPERLSKGPGLAAARRCGVGRQCACSVHANRGPA